MSTPTEVKKLGPITMKPAIVQRTRFHPNQYPERMSKPNDEQAAKLHRENEQVRYWLDRLQDRWEVRSEDIKSAHPVPNPDPFQHHSERVWKWGLN